MRNPTLHPKLSIQGMRTKQAFHRDIRRMSWEAMILVFLLVGLFFVIKSFDADQELGMWIKKVEHHENIWLSCLNNGAVSINNELHLCRPANTWIKVES